MSLPADRLFTALHGHERAAMTPVAQRQVRADYAARNPDGSWRYSLLEVARRNGTSLYTVLKIARTWGLSRYQTRGAPAGGKYLTPSQSYRT